MKKSPWIIGTTFYAISQITFATEIGGYVRTGIGVTDRGITRMFSAHWRTFKIPSWK